MKKDVTAFDSFHACSSITDYAFCIKEWTTLQKSAVQFQKFHIDVIYFFKGFRLVLRDNIKCVNAVTGGMFNNMSAIIFDQRSKFNLVVKLKEERCNECICMPTEEKSLALSVCIISLSFD